MSGENRVTPNSKAYQKVKASPHLPLRMLMNLPLSCLSLVARSDATRFRADDTLVLEYSVSNGDLLLPHEVAPPVSHP
jgi:hypothetical protein